MLCEAMLMTAGKLSRMGAIENGTTTSDYHRDEQEHGHSIHSSLLRLEWLERELNVIDTPGFPDFIGDAMCALQVADFALVVVDAVDSIGFGTERMWNVATDLGIPKILVINGADREHSDVSKVLSQITATFGDNVLPMSLPLDEGLECSTFLDGMRSELVSYKRDNSGAFEESQADGAEKERVDELHRKLIDYVAESDDALLEKFFEEGGLSEEELRGRLHEAIQAQVFVPLFCVAAKSNVGVARLLDFIAKFGSSPLDRKIVTCESTDGGTIDVDVEGDEPVVFVFKTLAEEHVGALSFFRIYSGELKAGATLKNTVRGHNERIGQILLPNGKERESTDHLRSGELGALVKLKNTHTSDTLCGTKLQARLAPIEFPVANIHAALVSDSPGDEEKISEGLALVHEEDPALSFRYDPVLRQTILSGQGQLHLASVVETLKRRHGVDIRLVPPRVPYRETIRRPAESRYRHKKQSGGAGQFAEVWMRIKPGARDSGIHFGHSLVGNNVDRGFVPSVEKGVRSAGDEGILAGYQVADIEVDFYDGKQHPVDSKDIAFQVAGKNALREAFLSAEPHLIEPILDVEIRVTDEALGNVLGDLASRGGRVMGTESDGHFQIVSAEIPQRSMYAYANDLRSLTGGRGTHVERFARYEDMPADAEKKIIAESKNSD